MRKKFYRIKQTSSSKFLKLFVSKKIDSRKLIADLCKIKINIYIIFTKYRSLLSDPIRYKNKKNKKQFKKQE